MRLLLVEELQARERLSLLLLKDELQKKGFIVKLSNSWRIESDIKKFDPEVVVDNISDSISHYAGKLYNYKGRNINLIWEQVVSPYSIHRFRFNSRFVENFVEGRISWGRSFSDIFTTLNPAQDRERIGICGSMNNSLLNMLSVKNLEKEDIGDLYGLGLHKYEKVVIIADTFKAANAEVAKQYNTHPFIKEINLMHSMYQGHLPQLCKVLAKRFKDTLFIVRAHPHKDDTYYNYFKSKFSEAGLENLFIQHGGSMAMLIKISDVVISHKSGVLADAIFGGIKAINFTLKGDIFDRYDILPNPVDNYGVVADEANIIDVLHDMLYGPDCKNEDKINTSEVFGDIDNNVFEKVADFILKISAMEGMPKRYHIKDMNHSLIKRITRNRVRYMLNYRKNVQDNFEYDKAYEMIKD